MSSARTQITFLFDNTDSYLSFWWS